MEGRQVPEPSLVIVMTCGVGLREQAVQRCFHGWSARADRRLDRVTQPARR
jgi:hypothetical protein